MKSETCFSEAHWQLVLVMWGTKYPVSEVNHLISNIKKLAKPPPSRIVLITDREHNGLVDDVDTCKFPDFYKNPNLQKVGCQAKLSIFEENLFKKDMPAIFVDIDTVVFGNIAALLALIEEPGQMAILKSSIIPFGGFARALYRVTKGRYYARGNSSVIVFHPKWASHISSEYRRLFDLHGHNGLRIMIADERFLSWINQNNMRTIPNTMVVKFPTEFMLPWRWLIILRAKVPWIRRRREQLIAVTLPGLEVKGAELLSLAEGDEIIDRKGRRLIWSDHTLGAIRARLIDYYTRL